MAERRKLTAALATPVPGVDEQLVRSFVTQSQATEQPKTISQKHDVAPAALEGPLTQNGYLAQACPTPGTKKSRLRPVGLIPITVRLRPELAGGLRRASLERELQGADLYTQQDLVEQVLEPWLKQEGYLV